MIRTVLTLRMGSQDMQDTTFLINDTQIGFLAPGGRRNHVLSSHRYIQLIAGFKADAEDPAQASAIQRDHIRLWQRCSRDVQQRGLPLLAQAAVHYRLRPDWLIGLDDTFMQAWLLDRYAIYLLRQGELFQVEPVSEQQVRLPEIWQGYLHQSTIEIMEGDYYLFLPPDFFDVVTPEEVQTILTGLQQLSVKINELVELARLRKYDLNETWIALQVQRIEPDSAQPVSFKEQWQAFRSQRKKPRTEELARQRARNSSLRQTTSLAEDDRLQNYPETNHSAMQSETDEINRYEQDLTGRTRLPGSKNEYDSRMHVRSHSQEEPGLKSRPERPHPHRSAAAARSSGQQRNRTKPAVPGKPGILDIWLSWRKEKRLLAVILVLALVILLAWGISALFNGGSDKDRGQETDPMETTLSATPTPLPPTTTTTIATPDIQLAVNVRSLNFREQPGKDSPLVTTLAEGSVVTYLEDTQVEGWIKVRLPDGVEAYAFAEYLSELQPSEQPDDATTESGT